jgi:hypothetical protein
MFSLFYILSLIGDSDLRLQFTNAPRANPVGLVWSPAGTAGNSINCGNVGSNVNKGENSLAISEVPANIIYSLN